MSYYERIITYFSPELCTVKLSDIYTKFNYDNGTLEITFLNIVAPDKSALQIKGIYIFSKSNDLKTFVSIENLDLNILYPRYKNIVTGKLNFAASIKSSISKENFDYKFSVKITDLIIKIKEIYFLKAIIETINSFTISSTPKKDLDEIKINNFTIICNSYYGIEINTSDFISDNFKLVNLNFKISNNFQPNISFELYIKTFGMFNIMIDFKWPFKEKPL